jgi:hypothetical protein
METLYFLEKVISTVWLIFVGPAHGLLFAQIPPRMGARRLRWTEAFSYGFAFLLALFFLHLICFVPMHSRRLPTPITVQAAGILAFGLTILLFGWRYIRVFSVSYWKACAFALAQAILLLAMLGLFRIITYLFAFLEYMVGT